MFLLCFAIIFTVPAFSREALVLNLSKSDIESPGGNKYKPLQGHAYNHFFKALSALSLPHLSITCVILSKQCSIKTVFNDKKQYILGLNICYLFNEYSIQYLGE